MNRPLRNRRSIRLKGYDYASAGCYFITFCTQNRAPLLGAVIDGEMVRNEITMNTVYAAMGRTKELRNINGIAINK